MGGLGWDLVIEAAVSIVMTALTLWLIESNKKAKLGIEVAPALTKRKIMNSNDVATYVGVTVGNLAMGRCLDRFFDRETAMSCRVFFQFYKTDGSIAISCPDKYNDDWIPGRWDDAVEPQYYRDGKGCYQFGYVQHEIDIPQGVTRKVQVAMNRPTQEKEKYWVWNDEILARGFTELNNQPGVAYLGLDAGEYIVEVKVETLGRSYCREFTLHISQHLCEFQMEPCVGGLSTKTRCC